MECDKPVSTIPPAVLTRCFGKQKPVTPHAQRLLVASRKESRTPAGKAAAKGKGKGNKGKGGKGKSGKGKGKGATKDVKAPNGSKKAPKGTQSKSAYAVAKDNFMQMLLLGYI